MELEKEILEKEGLDLRFFLLRLLNSIWIVFVAALAGAAICAGGYMLVKCINPAMKEYSRETKYYIDFAEDSTGIGYGYYNDYTWNDLMKSDDILNYTMSLLPEDISKETVENAVVADIISDVRLLTITVTTSDTDVTNSIADATAKSLVHFPEDIKEIDGIRVIRDEEVKEIIVGDLTKNFGVFGLVFGAVVSLFGICLVYCMDSAVYLPKDIENRFHIPVLGVMYKEGNEKEDAADNREEFLANAGYLLKGKRQIALLWLGDNSKIKTFEQTEDKQQNNDVTNGQGEKTVGKTAQKIVQVVKDATGVAETEVTEAFFADGNVPDYEALRQADAVVGIFSYGGAEGKTAERYLSDLKKQDCELTAAVLCDADRKMYRRYYFGKKWRNSSRKEKA